MTAHLTRIMATMLCTAFVCSLSVYAGSDPSGTVKEANISNDVMNPGEDLIALRLELKNIPSGSMLAVSIGDAGNPGVTVATQAAPAGNNTFWVNYSTSAINDIDANPDGYFVFLGVSNGENPVAFDGMYVAK